MHRRVPGRSSCRSIDLATTSGPNIRSYWPPRLPAAQPPARPQAGRGGHATRQQELRVEDRLTVRRRIHRPHGGPQRLLAEHLRAPGAVTGILLPAVILHPRDELGECLDVRLDGRHVGGELAAGEELVRAYAGRPLCIC